jgi:hypothetical protein
MAFHSRIAFDQSGALINNAAIAIPSEDLWVLGCLNSPVLWYYCYKSFPHKKDETVAMDIPYVEMLPIPEPTSEIREQASLKVKRLLGSEQVNQDTEREIEQWLRQSFQIELPPQHMERIVTLSLDNFIKFIQECLPKGKQILHPSTLKLLRDTFAEYVKPIQIRRVEMRGLERDLSELVCTAYGLSPQQQKLMWDTAPPRMPDYRQQAG